jgi:hypothetical protein
MSDKPSGRPPVRPAPLPLSESGSAHAPILYFEEVPTFGHFNGVIRVTLEAARLYAVVPGQVTSDRVVVAHLRMSIPAARSLIAGLQGALLLANPAPSNTKN